MTDPTNHPAYLAAAAKRARRLAREDQKIDRCPRCGAWRYALVCTGACPVLFAIAGAS